MILFVSSIWIQQVPSMDKEDMGLDLDDEVLCPYYHDSAHKVDPSLSSEVFSMLHSPLA